MVRLLARFLAPYRAPLVLVVTLLLLGAIGNLYLPELNASIINDGGASTLVRQELHRRPQLLASKKLVIWEFVERELGELWKAFVPDLDGESQGPDGAGQIPWLAALVCASAFDLALHDGFLERGQGRADFKLNAWHVHALPTSEKSFA